MLIDVLGNIFVKPATTPYRMQVKSTETEIEKSLTLKWEMRGSSLTKEQEKFVKQMADFLVENPNAGISVSPQQYTVKEKEYILLFEAKKKYFLATGSKKDMYFSREDAELVERMSVKEAQFVSYLNKHTADSMLFTVQDKCSRFLGGAIVDNKYKQLNRDRETAFLSYFRDAKVEKQITFLAGQNVIPYNGFSFYKIVYKGEFPEKLMDAYLKMNELNNESPRNLFKKDRKTYKGV